jgi:coenzyme F420-reducing hydrogenase alpha subunit
MKKMLRSIGKQDERRIATLARLAEYVRMKKEKAEERIAAVERRRDGAVERACGRAKERIAAIRESLKAYDEPAYALPLAIANDLERQSIGLGPIYEREVARRMQVAS